MLVTITEAHFKLCICLDGEVSETDPVFDEPETYQKPAEPESRRSPIERVSFPRPKTPEIYQIPKEPEPYHKPVEPEPYRRPVEPEPVKVQQNKPVEKAKEWYEIRPPPPVPAPPQQTEIKPEIAKPVKSILRHDPVNHYNSPEPETPVEEDVPAAEPRVQPPDTRSQPRHVVPQARTVVSRSWNDFESSRRKKSMELLEHRPTVKSHETRSTARVESEPYKLKRPTDYLPKQQGMLVFYLSVFKITSRTSLFDIETKSVL